MAGVSGYTIGQWARYGYIDSSQSPPGAFPRVYAFQDVAEAMMVHELLEVRQISAMAVKAAIKDVRKQFGYGWPLQHLTVKVPKRHPQSRGKGRAVVIDGEDVAKPHPVLTEEDLDQVVTDLHRGGWAARQLPGLRHIEIDPDVMSGRPVVRGTRVAAEAAGRLALRADGPAILREDYGLTPEQISDVRRWWEAARTYDDAA